MPAPPHRKGQNAWTDEQRLALHILNKEYTFEEATRTTIFNYVFEEDLKACGLDSGISSRNLSSQYGDRNRGGKRAHFWEPILSSKKTDDLKAKDEDTRRRIRDAVAALDADEIPQLREEDNTVGGPNQPVDLNRKNENGDVSAAKRAIKTVRFERSPLHQPADGEAAAGDELGETSQPGKQRKRLCNSQSSERTTTVQKFHLEMVHRKDIQWEKGQGIIDVTGETLVRHDSGVYQRGGQVCRLLDGTGQTIDCMICDTSACIVCDQDANPETPSSIPSMPFVHSSETTRNDGITIFRPRTTSKSKVRPKGFVRKVRFRSSGSERVVTTTVCDYVQCATCSGSEHLRIQENKKLDRQMRSGDSMSSK